MERKKRVLPSCSSCGKKLSKVGYKMCRLCFIRSHSTKFDEADYSDDFGNWLMGFVDGEGNFQCHKNGAGGFVFRIILREDDKGILEEIRQNLGVGKLFYRDVKKGMKNWNKKYQSKVRRNQWVYAVNSVYDLVNVVVPYFDCFKLRAKKKLQYENWRDKLLGRYACLKEGGGVSEME